MKLETTQELFERSLKKEGVSALTVSLFQKIIYDFFDSNGRELPWRKTEDPYHILISEIMLQQTQVDRVKEKYKEFIAVFPDFESLARASLPSLLKVWQGMGYNRRSLLLQKLAQQIFSEHGGRLPSSPDELEKLPGVGAATAASITVFAFNKPAVFIETNIRTVYIHHFFPSKKNVKDTALVPLIEKTIDKKNPRRWYSALMDYGSILKKEFPNPSRRSAHHVRQSPFEGSNRQIRGAIVKQLIARKHATIQELYSLLKFEKERIRPVLDQMCGEGLLERRGKQYMITG